jgi:hypothetical protein
MIEKFKDRIKNIIWAAVLILSLIVLGGCR